MIKRFLKRWLPQILAVLMGIAVLSGTLISMDLAVASIRALRMVVFPLLLLGVMEGLFHRDALCTFFSRHEGVLKRGVALLCTATLALSLVIVPANAAVTGTLTDSSIGLGDALTEGGAPSSASNPTASTASWSAVDTTVTGTVTPGYASVTTQGDGCSSDTTEYFYRTSASSTLTITNNSGETGVLSFDYSAPVSGTTLTVDGTDKTAAGGFSKELAAGGTVTVKITTPASPAKTTNTESSASYAANVTLKNLLLKPVDSNTDVTLSPVTVGGSYTAKVGATPLTVGNTYTNKASTEYTFTATVSPNYVFDGWYVNDEQVATTTAMTRAFPVNSKVEARFVEDALYSIVSLSDGAAGTKADYVEVNSSYYHVTNRSYHTNVGDLTVNNSYGARTYFADPQWSVSGSAIQSSTSGTATGDNQTEMGYSQAAAQIYSDIIRVKCLQNCVITFDCSMSANTINILNTDGTNDNQYGVFLYYYTSASASASASTIQANGTAAVSGPKSQTGSATGTSVVVNEGEYLYLYAYAWTRNDKRFILDTGYATDNYSYTAQISNFTVTPNTTEYTFTTGNIDNTGAQLKSGSVKINGTAQSVSSGSYTASMAGGSVLTLTPGTAPAGYVFIGWQNVTDGTYLYTSSEYEVTMTKDYTVYPIYVPVMTITTGGTNGYESASYTYTNLSKQTVTPNGQYVARNADCTAFYRDLNTAFDSTDTVFLLAGDTINNDLTIPTGKTLVIPDRLADPGPTALDNPEQTTVSSGITSYCKVTFNGNLTVNGTLVVNGVQSSAASGRAAGGVGFLSMPSSSTVTVNSGGVLCGFGEIRGGTITAKNGAVVREFMEVTDKRAVLLMNNINEAKKSKGVFPFSNLSVKTIESPVTYETGANLYAQYSVLLEGGNGSTGAIPLIAPANALFNLTAGTMTKSFDLATDKTIYRVDEGGIATTGGFELNLTFAVSGMSQNVTINTTEYWMPLNAGFDIRTAGDLTMATSFKFLPGACLSVEETGTCTIQSGQNLMFYRLNDYDTRGIGTSTYQKGYSSRAYPVNATNLPGGGYSHPTLTTVGSARLNVDGQMIVKGGLYVSNDLIKNSDQGITYTETVNDVEMTRAQINNAYFTLYKNGYNVLTGTGTVNMTDADTSKTVIYEAMTAANTNDPAFDDITITPIAGLKLESIEDTSDNYQAFVGGSVFYGGYRPYNGGIYVWGTEIPKVAVIIGEGNDDQIYLSLADAVYGYAGTGYIKMIDATTEPGFAIDRDVYLDLNGKTVTLKEDDGTTGTLTIAEGKTLYGMDCKTDDYDSSDAGELIGTVKLLGEDTETTQKGKIAAAFQTDRKADSEYNLYRYVAIQNGDNYSFHRFNISVTGYRFELSTVTPECALFFIGTFRGDSTAKANLQSVGFNLTDSNKKQIGAPTYILGSGTDSEYIHTNDEGAYLFEMYLIRAFTGDNAGTYTNQFGVDATVTFDNGGSLTSNQQQLSYWEAWQDAGKNDTNMTADEKARLEAFLKTLTPPTDSTTN